MYHNYRFCSLRQRSVQSVSKWWLWKIMKSISNIDCDSHHSLVDDLLIQILNIWNLKAYLNDSNICIDIMKDDSFCWVVSSGNLYHRLRLGKDVICGELVDPWRDPYCDVSSNIYWSFNALSIRRQKLTTNGKWRWKLKNL